MKKKIWLLLGVAGLLALPLQGVQAKCTPLINEGRDLLSKASLPADESNKIKGMLDEAAKIRDSGDHATAATKANEALKLLKKK